MNKELNKINDVYKFHEKHNFVEQDKDKTKYLMLEEWQEYQEARHMQDELDACVDYLYVFYGGLIRGHRVGFDKHIDSLIKDQFKEVFDEWWSFVQLANMTKGTNGKSVVKNSKIMKGEDFKPPEHFAEQAGFFKRFPRFKK